MSDAPESSVPERSFTAPLCCLECGQTGSALYERNLERPGQRQPASTPVSTSDGFYLRVNVMQNFAMQIVCARCGKVHRGPMR